MATTIHDIRQDKIMTLVYETCAFIRSHDSTYEASLQQVYRLEEIVENLTRYANAIQEKLDK